MTIFNNQQGHFHVGILILGVLLVVGLVGINVSRKDQDQQKVLGATSKADSDACLDAYDKDESVIKVSEFIEACGIEEMYDKNDPYDCDPSPYPNLTISAFEELCADVKFPNPAGNDAAGSGDSDGGAAGTDGDSDSQSPNQGAANGGLPTSDPGLSTVPVNLSSKNACIDSLKKYDLTKIKTYGKARVVARKIAVSDLQKKYVTKTDRAKAIKAREKAANKRIATIAKKNKYKLSKNDKVKVVMLTDGSKNLKQEISTYKKKVSRYGTSLNKAKSQQTAAEISCTVVLDSQVYSYLIPSVVAQDKIDDQKYKLAIEEINTQSNAIIAKITGKASAARKTNTSSIKSQIIALQRKKDAITPQYVKESQQRNGRNYKVFNQTLGPSYNQLQQSWR